MGAGAEVEDPLVGTTVESVEVEGADISGCAAAGVGGAGEEEAEESEEAVRGGMVVGKEGIGVGAAVVVVAVEPSSNEGMNDLAVGLRLRGFLGREAAEREGEEVVGAREGEAAGEASAAAPNDGTNGFAATFSVVDGADMVRGGVEGRSGTTAEEPARVRLRWVGREGSAAAASGRLRRVTGGWLDNAQLAPPAQKRGGL